MTNSQPTKILILGGGFGGVYTAMTLEKLLKKDCRFEIGLVNRENYLVFQPMLPWRLCRYRASRTHEHMSYCLCSVREALLEGPKAGGAGDRLIGDVAG